MNEYMDKWAMRGYIMVHDISEIDWGRVGSFFDFLAAFFSIILCVFIVTFSNTFHFFHFFYFSLSFHFFPLFSFFTLFCHLF